MRDATLSSEYHEQEWAHVCAGDQGTCQPWPLVSCCL